jgi:L-aminopeptidase/D-esterase-like protein
MGRAAVTADGVMVAAIMAVNAVGDVRDPETGRLIAGTRDAPDGRRLIDTAAALAAGAKLGGFRPEHTTIGCVVTDAALTKVQAAEVAELAMDGFARALSPPHLASDGDALFCLSVGQRAAPVARVGALAADVVARAIARGVLAATSLPGLPAAGDL